MERWRVVYATIGASPGRGAYGRARQAEDVLATSRARILEFLGLQASHSLVFTRSATEALNLAAFGLEALVCPGDVVVCTGLDHHSALLPLKRLARRRGGALLEVPALADGDLKLDTLDALGDRPIRLAVVPAVSNVNGNRPDLAGLVAMVARRGGWVVVDATQSVGHGPTDPALAMADLIAFSAHKMYGPKGVGALAVKNDLLDRLEPLLLGGGMVRSVLADGESWLDGPARLEAGTQDPALAAAFAAACDFLAAIGPEAIERHERTLNGYARTALAAIPGIRLIPSGTHHSAAILSFQGVMHGHDLSEGLSDDGICIRTGHLCAQTAVAAFGTTSVNRVSFGVYSTEDDVERLAAALRRMEQ